MAMLNPCHPGEILRDNVEAAELPVTEAAVQLGCTRQALSRLLNGKAGISPTMALALERIGWSNRVDLEVPRRSGSREPRPVPDPASFRKPSVLT